MSDNDFTLKINVSLTYSSYNTLSRILAVGWNRHVTEFEDTGMAMTGKAWETRHSDDVLAAASRPPISLATASYNSELLLWKMETGQPYRYLNKTI